MRQMPRAARHVKSSRNSVCTLATINAFWGLLLTPWKYQAPVRGWISDVVRYSKFWPRHDSVLLLERQPRVPSAAENVEEALGAEQKRLQLQSRIFPLGLDGESDTP